jgi:hypothetical protein
MTTIKVQECGCIALPDEIVEQTSLYPGSTLTIAVAPDGKSIQLTPITTMPRPADFPEGTTCG